VPTTQIDRGWINTNALSVVRVADQKLLATVLLDDLSLGFANPWAVDVFPDGSVLCVSAAGSHEIRLIDLPAMMAKIETAGSATGNEAEFKGLEKHNDLSFMGSVSRRLELKGKGPRALEIVGDTIYAAEYFSDSLGKVKIDSSGAVASVDTMPIGPRLRMSAEREGEYLFNDASMCFQQWQSCASCHSNDGRVDGLNWDLLNDGIGNPKNVKSLLLSHSTPPVMSLGVRDRAETAVRAGIRYIQFAVRPEEDAQKIDAYLKSLKPVPSPQLVGGELSLSAKRGKELFTQMRCIVCHSGSYHTDLESHDIGTGRGQDRGKKFDTPSLVEVWRTSPYLHDGRAATIEDAILEKLRCRNALDEGDRGIDEQALLDLANYVRSL
jgi:mono/diheme cytochrome c family protein